MSHPGRGLRALAAAVLADETGGRGSSGGEQE
jgi:hypothetical protein